MAKSKMQKVPLWQIFLLITLFSELCLVLVVSHFTHNASFNGSLTHGASFFYALNPVIKTLWTSEIIGLLVTGTYVVANRQNYKLGVVYAPNIAALMGLYGLFFGFYYTLPTNFNNLTDTEFPRLIIANLYLAGGLCAGWLLGKGLECSGKPGFWLKQKPSKKK